MKIEILKQNGHNFLWIDEYLWMWDIPMERQCQERLAQEAYGDVLCAGYGMGIVQQYLKENQNVKSVITVELHQKVIELCLREYGQLYGTVICEDFYDFDNGPFDCIVRDIWSDIVPDSLDDYKEFKAKAQELLKTNGKILAWGRVL